MLWLTNVVTYVFITSFTLLIDPQSARRTWKEALLFPGLINVVILLAAILPGPLSRLARALPSAVGVPVTPGRIHGVELFTYIWLAACMGVAFLGKVAETRRLGWFTGPLFVYIGGYGPSAVRDHRRRLRQGTPARRGHLGQDREDGQGGGPDVSGSRAATRRHHGSLDRGDPVSRPLRAGPGLSRRVALAIVAVVPPPAVLPGLTFWAGLPVCLR